MPMLKNALIFFGALILLASTANAAVVDVNITEQGVFSPATITITAGDSIRFVNSSDVVEPASDPHPTHTNYTALNVGQINTGSSATTQALTQVGTWGYHDHLATSITGTIIVVAKGSSTGGGGCPDCTPPGVGSLIVTPINHQSVIINWSTDEPAIFRVEFGNTTDYGSTTSPLSDDFGVDHSFIIKNLQPQAFYYYRIFVKDRAGNEDFSKYSTQYFRTLPIKIEATTTTSENPTIEKLTVVISKEEIIKEIKTELEVLQDQLYKELIKSDFSFKSSTQRGSKGEEIQALQILLSQDGSIYPEKQITGYFGPLTEKAVRRFQEKYGIETIGSVGPKTRAKLNQLLGRQSELPLVKIDSTLNFFWAMFWVWILHRWSPTAIAVVPMETSQGGEHPAPKTTHSSTGKPVVFWYADKTVKNLGKLPKTVHLGGFFD